MRNKACLLTDGRNVSFVIPRRKGGYVIGLDRTISHLDWPSRKVTTLAEVEHGCMTRFNDGKCDPAGRVFAGNFIDNFSEK